MAMTATTARRWVKLNKVSRGLSRPRKRSFGTAEHADSVGKRSARRSPPVNAELAGCVGERDPPNTAEHAGSVGVRAGTLAASFWIASGVRV